MEEKKVVDRDHIGLSDPNARPGMSGGQLLTKGYTNESLQLAWEECCGPQPEGVPRLHEDEDFALTRPGWERRSQMYRELIAELAKG